jgi:rare lipoprotein A
LRLLSSRCGLGAAALCIVTTGAGAVSPAFADASSPAAASPSPRTLANSEGTPANTATIAKVGVDTRRLNVRAGHRAVVAGHVEPGVQGLTAALQAKRHGRWVTLDSDGTSASGRYVLRDRRHATMSARVRVTVSGGTDPAERRLGRLNVYRVALASWYGPGLYGNRTGCGGTLDYGDLGVAHKSLPCGTKVTLRHRGRSVRVRVIDRGPYVGAREYDMTAATAQRLRFRGHGEILSTR